MPWKPSARASPHAMAGSAPRASPRATTRARPSAPCAALDAHRRAHREQPRGQRGLPEEVRASGRRSPAAAIPARSTRSPRGSRARAGWRASSAAKPRSPWGASIADGGEVDERDHRAQQQRGERHARRAEQAAGHREADVGVEAVAALGAGREQLAVEPEERARAASDSPRPATVKATRGERPAAPVGGEVDLRDRERAEEQRGKEHVVDELLQPVPEVAPVVEARARARGPTRISTKLGRMSSGRVHQAATSLPRVLW